MSLFQKSVINKYTADLDKGTVTDAYTKFKAYFHNTTIQENITNAKEEQFQEGFLTELFCKILGYTINPNPNFNLTTELKNTTNSKKADGAIIINNKAVGVIELKGTETTDFDKIETQAFGYKNNQPDCTYIITSNFQKLRFYIDNTTEYLEFNLFALTAEDFNLLWLCLQLNNIQNNIPKKIKEQSISKEDTITKQLYKDYSTFKEQLFNNLVTNNPQHDKLLLFKKTQKLLDRFLFIFFAEDRLLLPPNSIRSILTQWEQLKELDNYVSLYSRYLKYFGYMNTGYKGKQHDIYAYNGGLFIADEILDNVKIDDEILYTHTKIISEYDFQSEIDVNILGHIFENSLNQIEAITAEIEGKEIDTTNTKRKKDGVFYTPKYITKYIVENTVGKLCTEKKLEFGIIEEEFAKERKNRKKETLKALDNKLKQYREWLLGITICDPACGSGAFLNQALEFLIKEHSYIDELTAKLLGASIHYSDIENSILENNLFGVDINEESVEIAKLSLWLRTAHKDRKLNNLNNNIKCGNSLIDDVSVAGEKAFDWKKEFAQVFKNGGFDVVIGNPPYGAFLDKSSKEYYQKHFKTFQGNFEIYFFFIELGSRILKNKGKLGFITPDTWIKIPLAKKLREHVLDNYGLNNIVIFNHSVFVDAGVNVILFILSFKDLNKNCEVINFDSKVNDVVFSNNAIRIMQIDNWKNSEDKQFQVLQNDNDIRIIEKMKSSSNDGEKFLDVCQGIVPYSTEHLTKEQVKNRIYHSEVKKDDTYGIWIQGRAINRYSINLNVSEYLSYGSWLHRARKAKYFNSDRILIQEITGGNPPRISAINYSAELYHDPGIISCVNISSLDTKYLLALINSKLISWFNSINSPKGNRTTFPKVLIGDIRKFPIKEISEDAQKPFIEKADLMLSLNKELQELSDKFKRTLERNYKLIATSDKLQQWYLLTFTECIKELAKKKIKLSLKEQSELEDYFLPESKKAQELKTKIDTTDKAIDTMVYKLYTLTPEEIIIVEGK